MLKVRVFAFLYGLKPIVRWLKAIFRVAETDIFRLAKPAKKGGKSGKQNVRNKYALVTM